MLCFAAKLSGHGLALWCYKPESDIRSARAFAGTEMPLWKVADNRVAWM